MAPKLYMIPGSYPSRSVLLTAEAIGLKLELELVNLLAGDNRKPEFLKLNPRHQVPVLDDNGFILCESAAICCYLIDKYSKNDALYPKDVSKRAIVNERLFYHADNVFQKAATLSRGIFFKNWTSLPEEILKELEGTYEDVEDFLKKSKYIAGDQITVADIVFAATITSAEVFVKVDDKKFPKITEWLENMKKQSYFHVNNEGCEQYHAIIRSKLST